MTAVLPSLLAQARSILLGVCVVEGRADCAQGLTEGEEFSLCWVLPPCRDHPLEASAGIGSGGHLNNRNTGKELVVCR